MNARVEQPERVSAKELRGWNKDVVDLIREVVNDYGIRYRSTSRGSGALLLYPPDGGQPFKISNRRPADQTLKYLLAFARECIPGFRADEEERVEEKKQDLAAAFSSPERDNHPPKSAKAVQPPKEQPVSPTQITSARPVKPDAPTTPPIRREDVPGISEEWQHFVTEDNGYLGWSMALVDGNPTMRCDRCMEAGKPPFYTRWFNGMGGHGRSHGPTGVDAQREQAKKVRGAVEDAVLVLSEAIGLDITGGSSAELEAKVSKLEKNVADLTAERDELLAWKSTIQGLLGN